MFEWGCFRHLKAECALPVWNDLLIAFALVLVLEGIMPFLNPEGLGKVFIMAAHMDNSTLRFVGLTSMLLGVVLLYIVH